MLFRNATTSSASFPRISSSAYCAVRIRTYDAKVVSRPWTLLRFRSMISSIRSAKSACHAAEVCSVSSTASISSMELTLQLESASHRDFVKRCSCVENIESNKDCASLSTSRWDPHLQDVPSLRLPSPSSSEPALLAVLLAPRELGAELPLEVGREVWRDCALRDTVLPLSSACRRRSCMLDAAQKALLPWLGECWLAVAVAVAAVLGYCIGTEEL